MTQLALPAEAVPAAMNAPGNDAASQQAALQKGLVSASFLGLLVTQFLGAVNDNMFRWLVIGIGKDYAGQHQALLLSAGMAAFVVPYLVLAAPAGYLADRFSKRSVIVWCKVAEVAILLAGVAALWVGGLSGLYALFLVICLLGSQSALFGPSKLGSIPELVRVDRISAANGLVGLTTVIATVVGAAGGNFLADLTRPRGQTMLWASAAALLGVAAVGWLASLCIRPLSAANPGLTPPRKLVARTLADLRTLASDRPLLRVALGIAFFWSVGALAQLNIDQFAAEGDLTQQKQLVPLLMSLVLGVGVGSVLAGVWSSGRVELGMLPLGAGGVALCSMLLFTVDGSLAAPAGGWSSSFIWACLFLFALGVSAGLFDIPLAAYMQHCSPRESRGAILAASNFLTFSGILLAAGVYLLLRLPLERGPLFSARQIFLLAGLFTIPVFVYVIWLLPQASARFAVWLASKAVYRLRVHGLEHLPSDGPALLVSNHVTWLDGGLLLLASPRPVRMLAHADYVESRWLGWLARRLGVISIRPGRRSVVESLKRAREALERGELVCIFAEGAISRTGHLMPFKPGLLALVKDGAAPVVPVYLDELWGSIFSFEGGKFFWKWPRRWPYPVSIHFGRPLARLNDPEQARRAVAELGVRAVENRQTQEMILPRAFVRMCKRSLRRPKLADSTGQQLTGGATLMRSLILRRLLEREVLDPDEKYVGLLLPPSVPAALANVALPLAGRVPVNLNYTVSQEVMDSCIRQCGIRHLLTSRRVLEKFKFEFSAEVVCLEDLRDKVTKADKLAAACQAWLMPGGMLERRLGLDKIKPDDVLTVIFTSGSTGDPKGVMLTQRNVASNIVAIDQIVKLTEQDVVAGVLPFFHSFGYTTTLWTVLTLAPKGVYHFDPRDARQVGKMCGEHGATILIATPTFLRLYLKRCEPEDFKTLDVVLAGAEKLTSDLASAFEAKFGVRPVEGYGCTELSPLVSVNVPESRAVASGRVVSKEGTVGRPVPGVAAKVVDPESGADLGLGKPGMLYIKGPNVMKGYLNRPEQTAEVVRDGWYVTGDIAIIDEDGFIKITGRESRFAKIGGEMVPHLKVEEALSRIVAAGEDELKIAVTSVPDPRKGERLVVLHTALDKKPETICRELAKAGLPNLWIPSPDSFCQVQEIPVLGTGKLDLKALGELARQKFMDGADGRRETAAAPKQEQAKE